MHGSESSKMSESSKTCGCVSWKFVYPCVDLFTYFSSGRSVHPLEPVAPEHSEFFNVSGKIKLRIIHLSPEKSQPLLISCTNTNKKRFSLSEEYWFTRWNKPLRNGMCNCSFRRSDRFSQSRLSKHRLSNYDTPATKIINLETFVERLLQETFFEAFQEFVMRQNYSGTTNLGYICSENETDTVVFRRTERTNNQSKLVQSIRLRKSVCDHERISQLTNKPCILMLHGIGSTAEVWLPITNALLCGGFRVVAPDLLGHGFSSAPDKASLYAFESLHTQILAVFDHYIGTERCIIIGHSFGCSLATALYKSRAQQVVQLILISGGGPTPLAPPVSDNDISVLGCLQAVIKPLLFCGMKRSVFFSSRGKHFGVCEETTAVPSHILQYYERGQNWPEGDAAFHRKILIPTLLVHGLQDKQITLVQECEMERTVPRAFLELVPLAGHMSMLETPEHLSHMILCFIDWWIR